MLNLAIICQRCYGKDFMLSRMLEKMNNMDIFNSKNFKCKNFLRNLSSEDGILSLITDKLTRNHIYGIFLMERFYRIFFLYSRDVQILDIYIHVITINVLIYYNYRTLCQKCDDVQKHRTDAWWENASLCRVNFRTHDQNQSILISSLKLLP